MLILRISENGRARTAESGVFRIVESSLGTDSNLKASVSVFRKNTQDGSVSGVLSASVVVYRKNTDENDISGVLPGKLNVCTKIYSMPPLMAKIFIKGVKDFKASVFIPSYRSIQAKITIITVLKARIFITANSDLRASANVTVDHQMLAGKIFIAGRSDPKASINVTIEHQMLRASVVVNRKNTQDNGTSGVLAAIVFIGKVTTDLRSRLNVTTEHQQLRASIVVNRKNTDYSETSGRLPASALVSANRPGVAVPTGYAYPSGIIPVPQGEWQDETEVLFKWAEPDPGYGASLSGYLVAWNDEEDYLVTQNNQFVPDLSIQKNWYDSGSMWFHIKAVNSYGWTGIQKSCNIKINQLPEAPTAPFKVDGLSNGMSNSCTPVFEWENALDPDQLDVLSYELSILPSGYTACDPEEMVVSGILQSENQHFIENKIVKHLPAGGYRWRVRASDSKQFGPYCEWQNLTIEPKAVDVSARIRVVEYRIGDLRASLNIISYKNLLAKVFVPGRSDLLATINIPAVSDLNASVTLPPGRDLRASMMVSGSNGWSLFFKIFINHCSNLGASATVKPYRNLLACVNTTSECQKLKARINVCESAHSGLSAAIRVSGVLRAKLTLVLSSEDIRFSIPSASLGAKCNVMAKSNDVTAILSARMVVNIRSDIGAMIFIEAVSNLNAEVKVLCDRPENVEISCDCPNGEWQENNTPLFSWNTPEDEFFSVVRYYAAWNEVENYEATPGDQLVIGNSIRKILFDSGIRHFHIRAENEIGNLSANTAHYSILYNHKPGDIVGPLLTEDSTNPSIGTLTPSFTWGNAEDSDQLDAVSYNVQISRTSGFLNIIRNYENIPGISNSTRTAFDIPHGSKMPGAGLYYWRIRAFDGKEYGNWLQASFAIVTTNSDLGARASIPIRVLKNLNASIFLPARSELSARLFTYFGGNHSGFKASLNVVFKSIEPLYARISIPMATRLSARVYTVPYCHLMANLKVTGVHGVSDISARVRVCRRSHCGLGGSVFLAHFSDSSLLALIRIRSSADLHAKITKYTVENFGFIEDFSSNLKASIKVAKRSHKPLFAKVTTVADRPGIITVTSDIKESQWQEIGMVSFKWNEVYAHFMGVEGYYTSLDMDPDTMALDSFQKTEKFTRSFNLEMLRGAGVYYFHIAAKGANGLFGQTSHYAIWYNHLPSSPSHPMTVCNFDSILELPIVKSVGDLNFEWGQSTDPDDLDAIRYRMQVSTSLRFSFDIDGNSTIIYDHVDILTFKHVIGGGVLKSGRYYWRVRANDGHQDSSSWGPTGSFIVNTPPTVPAGLIVYS
jgi:hypothetical protein